MIDIQNEKEKLVVSYFVNHPESFISEVSLQTGVSKSSVQRYLKKHGNILISEGKTINDQLTENRKRGQYQGGIQSFKNNDCLKDKNGRFIGSTPTVSTDDKEVKKREDIKIICTYYLNHKSFTLDEVASAFHELFGYTSDYVYDCLLDSRVVSVMGEEKAKEIDENLEHNRNSFCKKISDIGVELSQITFASNLTALEENIFLQRLNNPNLSLDEVASFYHLSRAAVLKHENKAISKIQKAVGHQK